MIIRGQELRFIFTKRLYCAFCSALLIFNTDCTVWVLYISHISHNFFFFWLLVGHWVLLQLAEGDRGAHTKTSKQGLTELSFKLMDKLHSLWYWVKGHGVACIIQIHTNSCGPGSVGKVSVHFVVPGRVARVWAQETPGLFVVAQQAVGVLPFATDAPVGHADGKLPAPLGLPVKPEASQRLLTQHLGEAVEAIWMIWVKLDGLLSRDPLVPIWQDQLFVDCVWIKRQLAGV